MPVIGVARGTPGAIPQILSISFCVLRSGVPKKYFFSPKIKRFGPKNLGWLRHWCQCMLRKRNYSNE